MKANALLVFAGLFLLTAGCATQGPDYDYYYRVMDPPWWQNSARNTTAQPGIAFATTADASSVCSERRTSTNNPLPARPNVAQQASLAPATLILQPK